MAAVDAYLGGLAVDGVGPGMELGRVALGCPGRSVAHETGADGHVHRRRAVRLDPPPEVVAPGAEVVDPGGDRVLVQAHAGERELGRPAVVVGVAHGQLRPRLRAGRSVQQAHRDVVVAIGERVGLDRERVANDPLDPEPTAIDVGQDLVDDHAPPTLLRQGVGSWVPAAYSHVSSIGRHLHVA